MDDARVAPEDGDAGAGGAGVGLDARVRWRVIVPTMAGPDQVGTARLLAWHLADCAAPHRAEAHCAEGRRLLAAAADPDGHCLIDAACPRCAASNRPTGPSQPEPGGPER